MAAPQKDKTIQFWEDFHSNQEKEWILLPTQHIIEKVYDRLPVATTGSNSPIRILEIGCGTSTLSRLFYEYCRDQPNTPPVYVLATDVSQVCIQQLQERDADIVGRKEDGGGLEYGVLNIAESLKFNDTEQQQQQQQQEASISPSSFDLILDKGCLDTFAFRSRQRGTQKGILVNTVLSNVQSLLKDQNGSNDYGAYIIFSPRRKFRPVKEYPGFRVERTPLGVPKGEMMESNWKANTPNPNPELYMYTCFKDSTEDKNSNKNNNKSSLMGTDVCPKCGVSFFDFRKGEAVDRRGIRFWTREFRGHGKHCKGLVE